jgi:hypothetical protein
MVQHCAAIANVCLIWRKQRQKRGQQCRQKSPSTRTSNCVAFIETGLIQVATYLFSMNLYDCSVFQAKHQRRMINFRVFVAMLLDQKPCHPTVVREISEFRIMRREFV